MSAHKTASLYWSKVVRLRDTCERCGGPGPYEAAHIIRRRHVGDPDGVFLRTNLDNGLCLCKPCHMTVDADPVQMARLIDVTIGFDLYYQLLAVKNGQHRPWREADWIAERARLLAILKSAA